MSLFMKRLLALITLISIFGEFLNCYAAEMTQAEILKEKGDSYFRANRYSEALDYYTRATQEARKEKNSFLTLACLGSIGNVYTEVADYHRSVYYYQKAYRELNPETEQHRLVLCINLLNGYTKLEDTVAARRFYQEMMKAPVCDVSLKQYYSLEGQALLASLGKKYSVAKHFYEQAAKYAKDKQMNSKFIISSLINVGNKEREMGNIDQAIGYLKEALDISLAQNNRHLTTGIYQELRDTYRAAGNIQKAEEYNRNYLELKDSIFRHEDFLASNNQLLDYEEFLSEEKIDTLTTRNKALLYGIIFICSLLILVCIFYYILRREHLRLRETQRRLVQRNEELIQTSDKRDRLLRQYIEYKEAAEKQIPLQEAMTESESQTADSDTVPMSEDQRQQLLNKVISVFSDIHTISNPNFNLSMLTTAVDSNPKYVSWIINNEYGDNFKSVLNKFRITEACRRLADWEHYGNLTIQTIYKELGYGNATSFIKAFKKEVGMTPSQYLKLKTNGK